MGCPLFLLFWLIAAPILFFVAGALYWLLGVPWPIAVLLWLGGCIFVGAKILETEW
jgi:hypothetical protein